MAKEEDDLPAKTQACEKGKLVKEGLLKVKFPSGSRERKLYKAWESRWVTCLWNESPKCLELKISHGQKPPPNSQQLTCTIFVSPEDGIVYRSRSRTHPWAFSIAFAGLVLVHLASEREALSQSWMAAMRDMLQPPSSFSPFVEAINVSHRVSLIDDKTTCLTDMFAAFGHLYVTDEVLCLYDTKWSHLIKKWSLDDLTGIEMVRKDADDEGGVGGVFAIKFKKNISSHGQKLQFYSLTAASITELVSDALRNRPFNHTSGLGAPIFRHENATQESCDLTVSKGSKMCKNLPIEDKNYYSILYNEKDAITSSTNYQFSKTSQVRLMMKEQSTTTISHHKRDSKRMNSESTSLHQEQAYPQVTCSKITDNEMPEETAFYPSGFKCNDLQYNNEKAPSEHIETWTNLSGDFLNCSINSFVINNKNKEESNSSDEFSEYIPSFLPSRHSSIDDDDFLQLEDMLRRESFEISLPENKSVRYPLENDFRRSSCFSTVSNLYAEILSTCPSKRPSLAETLYEELDSDDMFPIPDFTQNDIYIPPLPPPREKQVNDSPQYAKFRKHTKRPSTLGLENLSNSIAETLLQLESQRMLPHDDKDIKVAGKTKPGWLKPIKGAKKILGKDKKTKSAQTSPSEDKEKYYRKLDAQTTAFREANNEVTIRKYPYPLNKDQSVNIGEADYTKKEEFTKVLKEPLIPFPIWQWTSKITQSISQSTGSEQTVDLLPTEKHYKRYISQDSTRKLYDTDTTKPNGLSYLSHTLTSNRGKSCYCLDDKQDQFRPTRMRYHRRHSKSLSLEIERHLTYLVNCSFKAINIQDNKIQGTQEIIHGSEDSTQQPKVSQRRRSSFSDYCDMSSIKHSFPTYIAEEISERTSPAAQIEEQSYMNMEMFLK